MTALITSHQAVIEPMLTGDGQAKLRRFIATNGAGIGFWTDAGNKICISGVFVSRLSYL